MNKSQALEAARENQIRIRIWNIEQTWKDWVQGLEIHVPVSIRKGFDEQQTCSDFAGDGFPIPLYIFRRQFLSYQWVW